MDPLSEPAEGSSPGIFEDRKPVLRNGLQEVPDMKANLLESPLTHNVRDCARQIWLAGLGAFARAQEEGGRFFETLVQEGQVVDARMKKTADEKVEQFRDETEAVKGQVGEIREKAAGAWNKLEEVFQTRVARALRRLGVPSRDDIQALFEQVELLSRNIQELTEAPRKTGAIGATETSAVARLAEPTA
jgi:poly(hydroxyalkanoate) granule-associated protein